MAVTSTDTIVLMLPLPPRAGNPNWRGNWHAKDEARRQYRRDVQLCGLSKLNEMLRRDPKTPWATPPSLARLTLVFGIKPHTPRMADCFYRPTDVDNAIASFKAGLDGLTDARLITDDDHQHMQLGGVSIDPTGEGVIVTLEVVKW